MFKTIEKFVKNGKYRHAVGLPYNHSKIKGNL